MEDIREERKGSGGKRGGKATKQCSTTPVVATAPCYVSMCGISGTCCPACSLPRAKDENEIEKTRDKRYRLNAKEQGKRKKMRERREN